MSTGCGSKTGQAIPEYVLGDPGCLAGAQWEYSSAVTRLFAILVFVLAGLPGMGVGMLGALAPESGHQCEESGCHVVVVESSCCSEEIEQDYCPRSGGPCQCGVAPVPDPQPRPETPLPGSQRDQIVTVPQVADRSIPILAAASARPRVSVTRLSLLAGMTHNDIQAFLGTWRT